MGVTTTFFGDASIAPPLNARERDYLVRFAGSRRTSSTVGPYYVDRPGFMGQDHTPDIIDINQPPEGQPSLYCAWAPNDDGTALWWDESEKFYNSAAWMTYLIDHFLRPQGIASFVGDPQFDGFTFEHQCDGTIFALSQPESPILHCYRIDVADNAVAVVEYGVPMLELDDQWWELVGDDLDLSGHIEKAIRGTAADRTVVMDDLAMLAELGQHGFVAGMRSFLTDLGVG